MTEEKKEDPPKKPAEFPGFGFKLFLILCAAGMLVMYACMSVDTLVRNGWLPKGPWAEKSK